MATSLGNTLKINTTCSHKIATSQPQMHPEAVASEGGVEAGEAASGAASPESATFRRNQVGAQTLNALSSTHLATFPGLECRPRNNSSIRVSSSSNPKVSPTNRISHNRTKATNRCANSVLIARTYKVANARVNTWTSSEPLSLSVVASPKLTKVKGTTPESLGRRPGLARTRVTSLLAGTASKLLAPISTCSATSLSV